MPMLECVVNVSEGRDRGVIGALAAAAGECLIDVHRDPHHHRSVFTLAGDQGLEGAVRALTVEGVRRLDLRTHVGVHPRLGVVDVVPFVPLGQAGLADAVAARDRFARWVVETVAVPCFLYGPERSLPEARREAFRSLLPDLGPAQPHPTAGAICVGARPVLVAYNLWLPPGTSLDRARLVAAELRGPMVRTLGLDVGGTAQVSCNLLAPDRFGPAEVYDAVAARVAVAWAELVGLVPESVLDRVSPDRWPALDLDRSKTIEYRLARLGEDSQTAAGRIGITPTPRPGVGTGPADGGGGAAPAH